MFAWIKDRLEIARLAQERANKLVEENRILRMRATALEGEVDRFNKVVDEIHGVVMSWKR